MFGNEPELMKGYAFGAAMANFQEMQKYMSREKFEVKYHLRTWEDALQVLYLAEQSGGEKGVARETKTEYAKLSKEKRAELNEKFLTELFGDSKDAQVAKKKQLHALALEISANQRILHKNEKPPGFESAQTKAAEQALLFKDFGEALGKVGEEKFDPNNPAHIQAVDAEYRRTCSEFAAEAAYHCAPDAFEMMIKDADGAKNFLDSYDHLMEARGKAKLSPEQRERLQKNLAEASRLTLLYALYDLGNLGEGRADRLLESLHKRFPEQADLINELARGAERLKDDPGAALPDFHPAEAEGQLTYLQAARQMWNEFPTRAQEHVWAEFGFSRRRDAQVIDSMLMEQELVWDWRKLGRERLADPITYDALAQILLTAVESDLDQDAIRRTMARELFFNLPIVGQAASAAGGGPEGIMLMGLGWYYPAFGHLMVAYSIGSASYEIYKIEIADPQRNNLEDALYRGFFGPELRDFGEAPPMFSDSDQKQLDEMEGQLADAQAKLRRVVMLYGLAPPTDTNSPEGQDYNRAVAEAMPVIKDLTPKIETIRRKQAIGNAYRDDRSVWAWQGGRFLGYLSQITGGSGLGVGAQPVQKPFNHYLLRDVQPLYAYLPQKEGVVDLTVLKTYDPATAPAQMAALQAKAQDETADVRERFRAAAELHELAVVQSNRYVRATNYLSALQKFPELRYRFQRDSIYPWMLQANTPSVQEFVKNWASTFDQAVTEEAISNNLVEAMFVDPAGGVGIGDQRVVPVTRVATGAAEDLTQRLLADMNRSRDLFLEYSRREKARLHKSLEENVDDAARRFQAETAGRLAVNQENSEWYQELLDTMRIACIRPNPPRLRATVYLSPGGPEAVTLSGGQTATNEPRYKIALQTQLTVNPVFYPGDPANSNSYNIAWCCLNQAEARDALASQTAKGCPLLPGAAAALNFVVESNPPAGDTEELLIVLVSAFSKTMPDFGKISPAIPGTARGRGKVTRTKRARDDRRRPSHGASRRLRRRAARRDRKFQRRSAKPGAHGQSLDHHHRYQRDAAASHENSRHRAGARRRIGRRRVREKDCRLQKTV